MAKARARCKAEPGATVFLDLPATGALDHQRTSLLFDQAKVKVIALCEICSDAVYDAALHLEFSGVIPVDSSVAIYKRAAAAVRRGELWVPRGYLSRLTRRMMRDPARLDLSDRETAILNLLLKEHSNQEIADQLFISRETVRWHLKALYAKLGVSDRQSARQYAHNLLSHS